MKPKSWRRDVFLFVLDGRVPDEGACVELGMAHAQRRLEGDEKLLIRLHTDTRAAFLGSRLNPMIRVSLDRIAEDEGSPMEILEDYETGRGPSS